MVAQFRLPRPDWLLRTVIESGLIVLSILLALAVDEWRENRNYRLLGERSLRIFEREIRQNLARLDDVVPYHAGLRNVVAQMAADPSRATDIRSVMEGLEPTVLLNTAWQTALATGALTRIDVETVSALSLTYSLQERFREESRTTLPQITAAGGPEARSQIQQALNYLTELARAEEDLRGVYQQALEIIQQHRPDSKGVAAPDSAGP